MSKRFWLEIAAFVLVLAGVIVYWRIQASNALPGRATLPEQVVFSHSSDDYVNAGMLFSPAKARPIAVIWVHGWGVNFYTPTYIAIGRALASRGIPCFSVNTRMHDVGNVLGYKSGKRIRGGGYWGVASDEVRDLAGWIDFAESAGYSKVVLIGHSAGWAAVKRYQGQTLDPRVVGIVSASGSLYPGAKTVDSAQLVQAQRIMANQDGEDLIKDPKRSFPSYISAATFMDIADEPEEFKDFFGFRTPPGAVDRIHCPILAFFGTHGDVGDAAELESLKALLQKRSNPGVTVTTAMIENTDHMYVGEEQQVADVISHWIEGITAGNR